MAATGIGDHIGDQLRAGPALGDQHLRHVGEVVTIADTETERVLTELKPADDSDGVILDTRPEHLIAPGTIHFAVLTPLAEVSAASVVGAPVVPATVTIHLLSRATPGRLRGRGKLLRRGRRLAVAEGEVFDGDKLVAKASVQFAVLG